MTERIQSVMVSVQERAAAELLELPLASLADEGAEAAVRRAFRGVVRRVHPDAGGDAVDMRPYQAARAVLQAGVRRRAGSRDVPLVDEHVPRWVREDQQERAAREAREAEERRLTAKARADRLRERAERLMQEEAEAERRAAVEQVRELRRRERERDERRRAERARDERRRAAGAGPAGEPPAAEPVRAPEAGLPAFERWFARRRAERLQEQYRRKDEVEAEEAARHRVVRERRRRRGGRRRSVPDAPTARRAAGAASSDPDVVLDLSRREPVVRLEAAPLGRNLDLLG